MQPGYIILCHETSDHAGAYAKTLSPSMLVWILPPSDWGTDHFCSVLPCVRHRGVLWTLSCHTLTLPPLCVPCLCFAGVAPSFPEGFPLNKLLKHMFL